MPLVVVDLEDERMVRPVEVDPDEASIIEDELMLPYRRWQAGSSDCSFDPEFEVGIDWPGAVLTAIEELAEEGRAGAPVPPEAVSNLLKASDVGEMEPKRMLYH